MKFGVRGFTADDGGLKLAAEQLNSERIERGSNGGNLIQDIDAIPILLDHALDTAVAKRTTPSGERRQNFHLGTTNVPPPLPSARLLH